MRHIPTVVAIVLAITATVPLPVRGDVGLASVEAAVAAGTVDHSVAAAVLAGQPVTAVVRYDVAATLERARAAGATGSGRFDDVLSAELRDRKGRVAAALGNRARVMRDFSTLGITLVEFRSAEGLLAAANRPEVEGIREDRVVATTDAESGPLVRQPTVQAGGHIGSGVGIAVLDTGVDYTNAAFGCSAPGSPSTCRVAAARDIAPDDGARDTGSFHGTNVSAVALSMAPGARIVGLDVFGATGTASSGDIAAAIDWVIANRALYNIRVMNLSLGGGAYAGACSPDPGFAEARAAGILPVVAAGNSSNASGVAWPACVPGAVSVGAVYDANVGSRSYSACSDAATAPDRVACFSQSGPSLSMLAPGAIISAAGISMAGTSQAAPHVAGAAAVLAGAVAGTTPASLGSALVESGPPINDPRNGLARRRLDIAAALSRLAPSTAPPPTPAPTPAPDTTAPSVVARTPAANATGVPIGTTVTATFSESVTGVSGSTMVLRVKATGAGVAATVVYDAVSRVATLRPSSSLAAGNSYTLTLGAGIRDGSGNSLPTTSWTFTTATGSGDTTAPVLTGRAPLAGATKVSTTTSVTATFSEPVTGVGNTSFLLRSKATGALVSATVAYDAALRRATLRPSAPLTSSTSYTASLGTAIRDASGNRFAGLAWTFTTAVDVTAPTLTARSPLAGATGVSRLARVTAAFSEPITGVSSSTARLTVKSTGRSVSATVSYDAATRRITIRPSSALAAGTTYRVALTSGIRDVAGNAFAGLAWTFTTAR